MQPNTPKIFYRLLWGMACALSLLNCKGPDIDVGRPNILWLVCEDQSTPFFPMYGDSTVQLPHIERLAAEGVVYEQMHTPAPVCSPARSAIITGMYPTTLGTHNMRCYDPYLTGARPQGERPNYSPVVPEKVKCFTEYLRAAGYYCTNNPKEDYNFQTPASAWDESGPAASYRNRRCGQPFFAVYNFMITHESRVWMYQDSALLVDPQRVPVPPYFPDDSITRHGLAVNYSNLIRLDRQIGELLAQLEADGLLDNTYIFFYSDNGGPFPRYKRSIYESGTKVPLAIRFPGAKKGGRRDSRLLSFIDLAPTMLSIAGIAPPSHLQGRPFLGKFETGPRQHLYSATDRFDEEKDRRRAVQSARLKYVRNYYPEKPYALPIKYRMNMPLMQHLLELKQAGRLEESQSDWMADNRPAEELYDLEGDPSELQNLARETNFSDSLSRYRRLLDQWIANTNDLGEFPEEELIARWLVDGQQPRLMPPQASRQESGTFSLSCPTEDASIVWEKQREEKWRLYTGAAKLKAGEKGTAKCVRIGYQDSEALLFQMPPDAGRPNHFPE